jgi:hypothetical protein
MTHPFHHTWFDETPHYAVFSILPSLSPY